MEEMEQVEIHISITPTVVSVQKKPHAKWNN
jgi:hypothetical protein